VGKKVNGTLERSWIYDGQLRPVAEYGPTGTIIATYVYATHINVPDYMVKSGITYRIITDHLGSLRFVIDTATGAIAQGWTTTIGAMCWSIPRLTSRRSGLLEGFMIGKRN